MQLKSINNEEKLINNILFAYIFGVGICGWVFVMVFLNGGIRECVFLSSSLFAILTKAFGKVLGSKTKYVYACIDMCTHTYTHKHTCPHKKMI